MKRNLAILGVFISLFCLTPKAKAQQNAQDLRVAKMSKALELSDDQATKFSAICTETSAKLDSLKQAHGSRNDLKPIMKTYDDKVMAILTDNQKAKYKNIKLHYNLISRGLAQ